ncbi:MAG: hypothetical protein JST35_08710 [Armatimonadetes bacterium]|nr:hypothetical protein [Armatimonadota bacterium]
MSFSIRLNPEPFPVDAGASCPIPITLQNRGETTDQVELVAEGVDPEWIAMPESLVTLDPGEERVARVFIKPSRTPESLAGNYPFVVRARSLSSGESRTASGVIAIKPFNHLSLEVQPKRGIFSPTKKSNRYLITAMNLGNSDQELHLSGADLDDQCAFEFVTDRVTVGPGQTKSVEVEVVPKNQRLIAGAKLFGFTVTGRSTSASNVAATTQAQLEQRPLMSSGVIAFIAMAFFLLVAWIAVAPKPATISLMAEPTRVTEGQSVNLRWEATRANGVQLFIGQDRIFESAPAKGNYTFQTTTNGIITVRLVGLNDGKQVSEKVLSLTVEKATIVPDPKIDKFSIRKSNVTLGEPVWLDYKFSKDVVRAVLQPTNTPLDLNVSEILIQPTVTGTIDYQVVAYNRDQKAVTSQKIRVTVSEKINVAIYTFAASKSQIEPGEAVTLQWKALGTTARLFTESSPASVPLEGSMTVSPTKTTTYTLEVRDEKGHVSTRKKTLTVKEPTHGPDTPDPGSPPPTTGGNPGDTTGATGTPGGGTGPRPGR